MRIIKNVIDVDLKQPTGEHLLINSLNGLVDVINREDYQSFSEWRKTNSISASTDTEKALYETLLKRQYILEEEEETELRQSIVSKLKNNSDERIMKCNNIIFILTYACNFACPYCYEKDINDTKTLTVEQVNKIIDLHNGNIGHVSFFGGEPLLLTNKEIIKHIIERLPHSQYSMITNGYYLEEYFDVFSKIKINNIQVTFDGNKILHNKTRILRNGKPTFDKIMQGVKLYAENGIPLTIRMNISRDNYESCLEVQQYIISQKWSEKIKFEMQPLFQYAYDNKNSIQDKLFENDLKSTKKNEMLKKLSPISNFLYNKVPLRPIIKACDADCSYRFYDPLGNIYSCIIAVGDEKKRVGVYEPELRYFEESFLARDITTIPQCAECPNALLCGGGCPNGLPSDIDTIHTPNCFNFMNELKYTVPKVYELKMKKKT
jgi:uncharacterized protein